MAYQSTGHCNHQPPLIEIPDKTPVFRRVQYRRHRCSRVFGLAPPANLARQLILHNHRADRMIKGLYDWTMGMADHPRALWVLAVVAFIESSVFPIPPDVIMIPMILAQPSRAWLIAAVALVSSVLGGMLGYAIGALAFETIGQPILASLGKADAMAEFNTRFNDLGFWAVLTAGVTPFPYKVITIMSGWTGMSLTTFIATSILARGLRFFILAGLLWKYGAPMRDFIEKRLGLMFTLFVIMLIGGFALLRYL